MERPGLEGLIVLGVCEYSRAQQSYTDRRSNPWHAWIVDDPIEALQRELNGLTDDQRHRGTIVVAGAITYRLADRITARFPEVDLILSGNPSTFDGAQQAADRTKERFERVGIQLIEGEELWARSEMPSYWSASVPVLFTTSQSYGVCVADFSAGGANGQLELTGAGVELIPSAHEKHAATDALIEDYYRQYAGLSRYLKTPLFPRNGEAHGGYAGSQSCAQCHPKIYGQWLSSPHGQALNTLLKVRRDFVPKCVRCHVVGMGESGGFQLHEEDLLRLRGVGCEMCHGGSADHVAAPASGNVRRTVDRSHCANCHDSEHSPEFEANFETYLENIRHW